MRQPTRAPSQNWILLIIEPEIAAEWDPAHWRCKSYGHIWKVAVGSRTSGNGCPCCSGRVATPEKGGLWVRHCRDIPISNLL